jgi:hypothetical protein
VLFVLVNGLDGYEVNEVVTNVRYNGPCCEIRDVMGVGYDMVDERMGITLDSSCFGVKGNESIANNKV